MITTAYEVRGALVTAVASVTNGTTTTLSAGDADYFLDLIEVTFANNSSAAASVTLLSDGSTVRTLQIPANDTVALQFNAPLKQWAKNTNWSVDMADITGTTISVGATLVKIKQ